MFFTFLGIRFTPFDIAGIVVAALILLLIFLLKKQTKGSKSATKKGTKMASKFGKKFKEILIKKFTTGCDFGGQSHPVTLYIGNPKAESHPLHFQSTWLSKSRGGNVPASIMDSFAKISKVAQEKHVSFPELCQYVVDEINSNNSLVKDAQQASEFSKKRVAEKLSGADEKAKPM